MKIIRVGRGSGNDIVINDPYVGRSHCEFIQDDSGNYWVIDLNSKNGTFVNGTRCFGKTKLNGSDTVRIGNNVCRWKEYFSVGDETGSRIITIGRCPDNNLYFNDSKVSWHHCRICCNNGIFVLEDLGSTNGTYVNGSRINREVPLRHGDTVRIGNTTVPWESYIHPNGTEYGGEEGVNDNSHPGTNVGKTDWTPGKSDPEEKEEKSSSNYGILVLIAGLAALGIIAYIIINYFTSISGRLLGEFGHTSDVLKGFVVYLHGWLGIGGQWFPIIAAIVIGGLADLFASLDDEESGLKTSGLWMANAAVSIGIIFLLLAIFAEKIVMI